MGASPKLTDGRETLSMLGFFEYKIDFTTALVIF
jgi:hypothetical protein